MAEKKKTTSKKKTTAITKTNKPQPLTGTGGKYNFPNARMKLIEQDDEKRAFMAKVVENCRAFWQVGLDPVKSDDELCERINYFFKTCAETQQLPTVEKMCLCIGYDIQTILGWQKGEHVGKGLTPACSLIIKKAKEILAAMDAELSQEGKIQPVVYMFRAKNFYGMRDQTEHILTQGSLEWEGTEESLIAESKALPTKSE